MCIRGKDPKGHILQYEKRTLRVQESPVCEPSCQRVGVACQGDRIEAKYSDSREFFDEVVIEFRSKSVIVLRIGCLSTILLHPCFDKHDFRILGKLHRFKCFDEFLSDDLLPWLDLYIEDSAKEPKVCTVGLYSLPLLVEMKRQIDMGTDMGSRREVAFVGDGTIFDALCVSAIV